MYSNTVTTTHPEETKSGWCSSGRMYLETCGMWLSRGSRSVLTGREMMGDGPSFDSPWSLWRTRTADAAGNWGGCLGAKAFHICSIPIFIFNGLVEF